MLEIDKSPHLKSPQVKTLQISHKEKIPQIVLHPVEEIPHPFFVCGEKPSIPHKVSIFMLE